MSEARLDASESAFFKRQLEAIDTRVYETKFPEYMARRLIPTVDGVDSSAHVYTYRMTDSYGKAKAIGNLADDLPRADVKGVETSQLIKHFGASYGYSIYDIRAASRSGMDLPSLKAMAARRALEEEIDRILALGHTTLGLSGLLTLSSTTTFTPVTKALGGTTWGTASAPNATPDEVGRDIIGLVTKLYQVTYGAFKRFRVLMPMEQYLFAALMRMGDGLNTTALEFAKSISGGLIESIEPWYRCDAALSNGLLSNDRMVAYPYSPEVLGALVPEEINFIPPQERNLEFVVNGVASCGGVIARYPIAVGYADSI